MPAFRKRGPKGRLPALVLLLATAAHPLQAADIWLGAVSPGLGSVSKRVTSFKERKFADLVRQETDFSCGAAAVATIFNYAFGKHTGEAQVLANMLKVSDPERVRKKGFSLLDIKRYVEAIGLKGIGLELSVSDLHRLKVPTIVLMDIKGYKHFVVLKKIIGDRVYVGDPALGNRSLSAADFEASWNRVVFAIVGEGYREDTVLRQPQEAVTAHEMFGLQSPLVDAVQYDFGLIPSQQFKF